MLSLLKLLQVAIILATTRSPAQSAPQTTHETAKPETAKILEKLILNKIKKDIKKTDIDMDVKDYASNSCKLVYRKFVFKHPKCIPEEVALPVCVGQCNSMYFPGNNLKDTFGLCQSCQPTSKGYKLVILRCPDAKQENKKIRIRKVEFFKGCACRSCR